MSEHQQQQSSGRVRAVLCLKAQLLPQYSICISCIHTQGSDTCYNPTSKIKPSPKRHIHQTMKFRNNQKTECCPGRQENGSKLPQSILVHNQYILHFKRAETGCSFWKGGRYNTTEKRKFLQHCMVELCQKEYTYLKPLN